MLTILAFYRHHKISGVHSVMLADKKVCILIANGFAEHQVTELQRTLTKAKVIFKIVAPEQGLVNGWQGAGWGHYFTVDSQIGATLGSDFDGLVLIGGERAQAKLAQNPHSRRIVNHFLEAEKPIAAIGEGVALLALTPKSAGLTVAAPESITAALTAAQVERVEDAMHQDNFVLTADGTNIEAWVEAVLQLLDQAETAPIDQAA